jgi:hypothetical protein
MTHCRECRIVLAAGATFCHRCGARSASSNFRDPDGQPPMAINAEFRHDRSVSEMLGLLKGILADGIVTPREVMHLANWILANVEADAGWPLDVLAFRVSMALEKDPDERTCEELAVFFRQLVHPGTEAPGRNPSTALPLTHPLPALEFAGRCYVFTGKFDFGSRRSCEEQVTLRGGVCKEAVGRTTDVLVIGNLGSRDWMQTSFGRKIEMAVQQQRNGRPVAIVSEQHWIACLRASPIAAKELTASLQEEDGRWLAKCNQYPEITASAGSREEVTLAINEAVIEFFRRRRARNE